MKNYHVNLILGCAITAFSLVMLYETIFFSGDAAIKYYPRANLVILMICGIWLVITNNPLLYRDKSLYKKDYRLKSIFLIILLSGMFFYTAEKLGFYIGTLLFFIIGGLATTRSRRFSINLRIFIVGIVFSFFLFLSFQIVMKAPIPSNGSEKISDIIRQLFLH